MPDKGLQGGSTRCIRFEAMIIDQRLDPGIVHLDVHRHEVALPASSEHRFSSKRRVPLVVGT
jgi:hypothetical protein